MKSSEILRRVAVIRTDVSEERSATFIRVGKIGELRTTLAVTSNRYTLLALFLVHRFCHPDEGGATFLGNVGSYNRHTA
jgi:hypothetical protein